MVPGMACICMRRHTVFTDPIETSVCGLGTKIPPARVARLKMSLSKLCFSDVDYIRTKVGWSLAFHSNGIDSVIHSRASLNSDTRALRLELNLTEADIGWLLMGKEDQKEVKKEGVNVVFQNIIILWNPLYIRIRGGSKFWALRS